jgi:methylmalonyl-CoA mutase N-terminal domain/subunit
VRAALAVLKEAAQGDGNLVPAILNAVRAYATMGEMCGVLREVFGDYRPPTVI